MKKILVIRMSAIGDIVLSTSFLESVKQKYPDSEIHFLVKKEFSDLVKKHPIIDKLISFDKKLGLNELFRLGRFLRSNNYDIIFDIHSVFRTRILSLFLRKNLFKILSSSSFELCEQDLSTFDITQSDEIFGTNIAQGIFSVTKFRKKDYDCSKTKKIITMLNNFIS